MVVDVNANEARTEPWCGFMVGSFTSLDGLILFQYILAVPGTPRGFGVQVVLFRKKTDAPQITRSRKK